MNAKSLEMLPTLYKYSSTGKIQQWDIMASEFPNGEAEYSSTWGQVGGSTQTTTITIDQGKNIGKANETSPYQQALSEAKSKWKKQKDKGYSEGAPKKTSLTSPMLAKSYDKHKKKVTFPCIYQPKLDGMRCIAQKTNGIVTMVSRRGKLIDTLPHINSLLEALMDEGEITDGELYTHGVPFQRVMSWVKRNQPDSAKVQYNIYDLVNDDSYPKRFKRICQLVGNKGQGIIRTVYTDVVNSFAEIAAAHKEQCARGFEGIMLRVGDCNYKCGSRSVELLKVKKFFDDEYLIVDAEENIGKQAGQCTFICETDNGTRFKCKPMGDDVTRREYWTNKDKYIGKMLTVRYFELTTSDNPVPRFPVGIIIRDYE